MTRAALPLWRGLLLLAFVACPVALYTARHDAAGLHFHFINPETGNRVRTITQDAETGDELARRDLARGYEFEKDRYVVLDDDDFEQARIESSSTMTVDKFVAADSIDPVFYESSYYMAPDGDAGQDVYVVLREAIAKARGNSRRGRSPCAAATSRSSASARSARPRSVRYIRR